MSSCSLELDACVMMLFLDDDRGGGWMVLWNTRTYCTYLTEMRYVCLTHDARCSPRISCFPRSEIEVWKRRIRRRLQRNEFVYTPQSRRGRGVSFLCSALADMPDEVLRAPISVHRHRWGNCSSIVGWLFPHVCVMSIRYICIYSTYKCPCVSSDTVDPNGVERFVNALKNTSFIHVRKIAMTESRRFWDYERYSGYMYILVIHYITIFGLVAECLGRLIECRL